LAGTTDAPDQFRALKGPLALHRHSFCARIGDHCSLANGTAVIGSPKRVLEKIERVRDQTGLENLITMLQFGVMPDELAVRNIELFASEVMPKLR
jgi:alkanesulfonate monooxygenase SsuD/methylene tetrahydromethanopterin reductase-like flavin-dependent oxidoreductase (luciferase family)